MKSQDVAETMYQTLLSLSRSLNHAPPEARQTLLYLALRAALHPSLAVYLDEPLLPLGDQYISLDAHILGLLQFARDRADVVALTALLGQQDRERIARFESFTVQKTSPSQKSVGCVRGVLYLPAMQAAVPCRVWAARVPYAVGDTMPMRWPDPVSLRPVSAAVADSAKAALAGVLETLQRAIKLPAPVLPTRLYYDFSVPDIAADVLEGTSGDSLGLPLALVFLSALTDLPLPADVAATGAVGKNDRARGTISSVGWVPEKIMAVAPLVNRILIPADETKLPPLLPTSVIPVATVAEAALQSGGDFQTILGTGEPDQSDVNSPVAPAQPALCFVYLAIEESAQLWESSPDAMRETVHELDRLVQHQSRMRDGYLFRQDTDDGGLCIAFPTVRDGCTAALAIQQGVLSQPWRVPTELRVAMGIHYGEADLFRGNYSGAALGQTRRILEAAHGGQILVSESAQQALRSEQHTENWSLTALGTHRLRDLTAPVALYQLRHEGLPDHFQPPRSLDSLRSNLPVLPSPLLAREKELAALTRLLRDKQNRLITLTGVGGVGKTRLAQQAGAESLEVFPDGVWFVALADLSGGVNGGDIADAIISAMKLSQKGGSNAVATVREALAEKRLLLILDNFETVVAKAVFASDLLRAATGVSCLVTSRVLLQLQHEQRFEVLPLSLPEEDDPAGAEMSGAVALFLARARAANSNFVTDQAAFARIARICRRLDGLPLALELAAARVRTMSLAEIEERLGDAFPLLVTRLRDVPERQRTLRNTLEWSYSLLSASEAKLLMRISVFGRDFTGEAAEAVGDLGYETAEVLERLEEQSLVQCEVGSESSRWRLLKLIQEFAREKLAGSGEEIAARAAHAHYFARLAQEKRENFDNGDEFVSFNTLETDLENLRLAHEWFREEEPFALSAYVLSLTEFLRLRGHWRERSEWLEAARSIAIGNGTSGSVMAQIYFEIGLLCSNQHKTESALYWLDQANVLADKHRDMTIKARVLNVRGLEARRGGDLVQAIALHTEARELAVANGNVRTEMACLNNLAVATGMMGDIVAANRYYEEVIQRSEKSGDINSQGAAMNNSGMLLQAQGQYEDAYNQFARMLHLARTNKDSLKIAIGLLNIGEILSQLNRIEKAVSAMTAAMILFERLGHPYQTEAQRYLSLCREQFGSERADALYRDYARQLNTFLQHVDISIGI